MSRARGLRVFGVDVRCTTCRQVVGYGSAIASELGTTARIKLGDVFYLWPPSAPTCPLCGSGTELRETWPRSN